MSNDVTVILDAIEAGDRQAASRLLPLVYEELRRLAAKRMAQEGVAFTLQPTALVHEAFLRLVGEEDVGRWDNRGHFFAAAAEAMRRILIDAARRRKSQKRGGQWVRQELNKDPPVLCPDEPEALLALDEALTRLTEFDPELARLVKLRYFTGLTIEQTAEVLQVSPRTTRRNWTYARAWLKREMDGIG
ncbi:MAG: ECF-type sigma factor [Fuerstiella sp.]